MLFGVWRNKVSPRDQLPGTPTWKEQYIAAIQTISTKKPLEYSTLPEHRRWIWTLGVDLLFAAANTWFSLFAWICEYLANTSGAISKRSFEGLIHRFYCFFGYICIALACKKQHMQLIWLTFEIIDDLDFQERIHAQAKLPTRPKNVFLGVRIHANTWFSLFARTCEYSANSANTSGAIWESSFEVPNSVNTK